MGIEDILKKNDAKRASQAGARRNVTERAQNARAALARAVEADILNGLRKINDRALGLAMRLPIASKPTEIGIYFECEGIVRFTLHCVVRADQNGDAFCSSVDLAMSRSGKTVRGSFEPTKVGGNRPHRLGYDERHFHVDPDRLNKAIEALANQL